MDIYRRIALTYEQVFIDLLEFIFFFERKSFILVTKNNREDIFSIDNQRIKSM